MQVKMMHIQMCVKNIMFGASPADAAAAWGNPYQVLLSKLMDIRTATSSSRKIKKAVSQALPGYVTWLSCSSSVAVYL